MKIEIQLNGLCAGTHRLILGENEVTVFFTRVDDTPTMADIPCTEIMRGNTFVATLWDEASREFKRQWNELHETEI